jgi:molybdopterin-guanine dinucleotide biosynthesis protein A
MTASAWSLGVLAGGRSTRMGEDKAACLVHGVPLLDHVVARHSAGAASVLVAHGRAPGRLPSGAIAVADPEPGLGPLAGVAAVLAASPTPFALVVPVDMPLLPPDCGAVMEEHCREARAEAVVLSHAGRTEPFPLLASRDLASVAKALLREGQRRADCLHGRCRLHVVSFTRAFPGRDAGVALLNVNTRDDLARAEGLLASEPR